MINAEQKAREWLAYTSNWNGQSTVIDGREIITALLAEREEMLVLLEKAYDALKTSVPEEQARKVLAMYEAKNIKAMCEEQKQ